MKKYDELIKEILLIIVASLFLGIILTLDISLPVISFEPSEFGLMFLFSIIMLSVFVLAQKFTAFRLDCKIKTKFLSFRRYWFQPPTEGQKAELPFDFPAWLALPLILALITNGFIRWLAILDFDIKPKASRLRRRWQELSEEDVGRIAISGPVAVLILGLIVRIAGFNEFAILCAWLSFLALIPIGQGFKIMNTVRISWFFAFIFSIFILLLMNLTANTFATIIVALLITAIITIIYYSTYER